MMNSNLPESDDLAALEQELAPHLKTARLSVGVPDRQRTWDRIEALGRGTTRQAPLRHDRTSRPAAGPSLFSPRGWLGASAIAAAVAGIVLVRWAQRPVADTLPGHTREYVTAPGERAVITLNDGSRITLNSASRLRIADGFGENTRTVELDGEARFVVQANPSMPFIVQANGSHVRDLATDFVVRAYPGGARTTIAVRDGSVAVQSPTVTPNNAVIVRAFERADVAPDGRVHTEAMPNPDADFAWSEGRLVLADLPLGDALVQLSRWYGMQFRVANPDLLRLRINAVLPERYDHELLKTVAATMGAKLEVRDTVITFVGQ